MGKITQLDTLTTPSADALYTWADLTTRASTSSYCWQEICSQTMPQNSKKNHASGPDKLLFARYLTS